MYDILMILGAVSISAVWLFRGSIIGAWDFRGVSAENVVGKIIKKIYNPSMAVDDYGVLAPKPMRRIFPAERIFEIKLPLDNERVVSAYVSADQFDEFCEGCEVRVSYMRGKKTGNFRIVGLSLV